MPTDVERTSPVQVVTTALHHVTHLDALVHVHAGGKIYGGKPVNEILTENGWKDLGVETVPPIIGRCVLLDIAGEKCVSSLPDGYEITIQDLEEACQSVAISDGDIVLVRTGKIKEFWDDPTAFVRGQPGIGAAAATWLYERGMAVLGTDTPPEPAPIENSAPKTHEALLVERGCHIIENLCLEQLSESHVTHALFVCLLLKTGSFVRPVAIV